MFLMFSRLKRFSRDSCKAPDWYLRTKDVIPLLVAGSWCCTKVPKPESLKFQKPLLLRCWVYESISCIHVYTFTYMYLEKQQSGNSLIHPSSHTAPKAWVVCHAALVSLSSGSSSRSLGIPGQLHAGLWSNSRYFCAQLQVHPTSRSVHPSPKRCFKTNNPRNSTNLQN